MFIWASMAGLSHKPRHTHAGWGEEPEDPPVLSIKQVSSLYPAIQNFIDSHARRTHRSRLLSIRVMSEATNMSASRITGEIDSMTMSAPTPE
jgi:hypothetical protein